MKTEELMEFLHLSCSIEQNKDLLLFSKILIKFIEDNRRIPHLPNDLNYLLSNNLSLDIEDFAYLLENCTKFVHLESEMNYYSNEPISNARNILKEFKISSILAAEIQKIITRKYLPEVKVIKI